MRIFERKQPTKVSSLADYAPYSAALDKLGQLQTDLAELEQDTSEQLMPGATRDDLEAKRRTLTAEIERQLTEVFSQKYSAARQICEAAKPEYRAIMQRCALSLIEAARAFEFQRKFLDALDARDVSFSTFLPAAPFGHLDARDESGPLFYWLSSALSEGLIDRSLVPHEWLQAWRL